MLEYNNVNESNRKSFDLIVKLGFMELIIIIENYAFS